MTTEDVLSAIARRGDPWQAWRAARLVRRAPPGDPPPVPYQHGDGAFIGPGGGPSAGATGEGLCHLVVLGLTGSPPARAALRWLQRVRTPAQAWLDAPEEVPGELDTAAGGRVWATAAAACGMLAAGADPGARAIDLLRGEGDLEGRFTGGAYPTFAAAGAYWLADGAKTEMAEWALRWAREAPEEWWGPWERASALTFWAAAGIPAEHATIETFLEALTASIPPDGWDDDPGLTLRAHELVSFFGW